MLWAQQRFCVFWCASWFKHDWLLPSGTQTDQTVHKTTHTQWLQKQAADITRAGHSAAAVVVVVLFFMRCGSLIRLFRSYRCQKVMASCCTKSNNLRNNYLRWSHSIIIIIMKSDGAVLFRYVATTNVCIITTNERGYLRLILCYLPPFYLLMACSKKIHFRMW